MVTTTSPFLVTMREHKDSADHAASSLTSSAVMSSSPQKHAEDAPILASGSNNLQQLSPLEPEPSLNTMPLEVLCLILEELSDLKSLAAAIKTSPSFHLAFKARRSGNSNFLAAMRSPEAVAALKVPFGHRLYMDFETLLGAVRSLRGQDPKDKHALYRAIHGRDPKPAQVPSIPGTAEIRKLMGLDQNYAEAIDPQGWLSISGIFRTCEAHGRLIDMYKADPNTAMAHGTVLAYEHERRGGYEWGPPSLEQIEAGLWRFEHFCRLFGGVSWYHRWGPSVHMQRIIDAFCLARSKEEQLVIHDVHQFLCRLFAAKADDEAGDGTEAGDVTEAIDAIEVADAILSRQDIVVGGLAFIYDASERMKDEETSPTLSAETPAKHPFFLTRFLRRGEIKYRPNPLSLGP